MKDWGDEEVILGDLELYHYDACPFCEKVRRALKYSGLEYRSREIDPDDRTEVLERTGQSGVPAMIIDSSEVITDSKDIIKYINSRFSNGTSVIPNDPRTRAQVYIYDQYVPLVWGILYKRAKKLSGKLPEDESEGSRVSHQKDIDSETSLLNDLLHGQNTVIGDSVTLADITFSAYVSRLLECSEFTINRKYDRVWNWYDYLNGQLT